MANTRFLENRLAMWFHILCCGMMIGFIFNILQFEIYYRHFLAIESVVMYMILFLQIIAARILFMKGAIPSKNRSDWYHVYKTEKVEFPVGIVYTKARKRKKNK